MIELLTNKQLRNLTPEARTTYLVRLCIQTPGASQSEREAIQKEIDRVRMAQHQCFAEAVCH